MDMKTVYKALPLDLFEDILGRFKRQQACKKDCMAEYMSWSGSSRENEWCRHLLTNDDADDPGCQRGLDYKLEQRMDSVLRDMRYTFFPLDEDEYVLSEDECDYPYDEGYDYQSDVYPDESDEESDDEWF